MEKPADAPTFAPICPMSGFPLRIGDKWTAMVVLCLEAHPRRFSELRQILGSVSAKVLTETLRAMERDGLLEIILIHHTDCGMLTFTDDDFKRSIQAETGIKPEWAAEAFPDLDEDVRQSIARIQASPFIPHRDAVRGFVFDVATGLLKEVA